MDNLIEKIKEYIMEECRKYKEASEDHYDFWNEHIRYVYKEAVDLAKKYGADLNSWRKEYEHCCIRVPWGQ